MRRMNHRPGENLISEMMSLRWWKDTRSSRVSAFTIRKLPSFRPTARALPSGEKQQQRPPAEDNVLVEGLGSLHSLSENMPNCQSRDWPFLSLRTASMQWLGERSHMRRVLSSLTVAQRGRWGCVARPHTSPSIWPCRDIQQRIVIKLMCLIKTSLKRAYIQHVYCVFCAFLWLTDY